MSTRPYTETADWAQADADRQRVAAAAAAVLRQGVMNSLQMCCGGKDGVVKPLLASAVPGCIQVRMPDFALAFGNEPMDANTRAPIEGESAVAGAGLGRRSAPPPTNGGRG